MRAEATGELRRRSLPGGPVSAYRDLATQQQYLYDLFLAGAGRAGEPARQLHARAGASPSTSRTEEMRSVIDQIGPAYGWYAPHSNEWWHVEYWG